MRLPFVLLCALGLGACAMAPLPPNPSRVSLLADQLTVHYYDGTSCSADIKAAPEGRFAPCGQQMDYAVTVHHPSIAQGTGLDAIFEPYATITLTRPEDNRQWTWRTPQGDTVSDDLMKGQVRHR